MVAPGGRPSIDKLLPVLDRYDWMPAVMNTKQDDINFLNMAFFFLSLFSHFTCSLTISFVLYYRLCVCIVELGFRDKSTC